MTEEHFDVVVVGSGFGGSVVAHTLAAAGARVCILERGKAFPPGSFPRSPHRIQENFWDPSEGKHGMFDVWRFRGINVLISSGLGGGSLIYANVLIRKDPRWFTRDLEHGGYEYWPVTREELDPHYDHVEKLIGVQVYPKHLQATTPKCVAYVDAAKKAGFQHQFLPLAVSFSREGQPNGEPMLDAPPNRYGVTRQTCRLCGECDVGCNFGSKNSLDLTVISQAERLGVQVRTRAQVCAFKRVRYGDGDGWRVEYIEHKADRQGKPTDTSALPRQAITAKAVVLAAGTLGSTFLMLQNRRNLNGVSAQLGRRFSGNGDFLGLALAAEDERGQARDIEPGVGPVITGAVRIPDAADGGQGRGFYVEDAGYPDVFNWVIEAALTATTTSGWGRVVDYLWEIWRQRVRGSDRNFSAEISRLFGQARFTRGALPMLGMGRDVPDGEMSLDDDGKYLELVWKNEKSAEFFARMQAVMKALATAMGAGYRESPLFSLAKRLITVHPLGGCSMGRNPAEGVVDDHGEVFGAPGLFVADGAVMPGPVGPNPALTIAALSHRFADRVLERVRSA